MKDFTRTDLSFSLCGLNCGLCPMRLGGHCPGCGGGADNTSLELTIKEKAEYVVSLFENVALQEGLVLKLRKKPTKIEQLLD